MRISKAIIAVLFSTTASLAAFSQYPDVRPFKTLNVADGLPQSFISGLVQDSAGFIWIATRDGLARDDGRQFKIFKHIAGNTGTLSNNTITGLYLDKSSRLWIAYETGDIDLLNTTTEILCHLTKDSVYRPLYGYLKPGNTIAEDKKGNTWLLGSKGGLFICNLNKRQCNFYSDTALGIPRNKITGIAEKQGEVTLVTDTALITINESRKFLKIIPYTFSNHHLYDPGELWKDAYTFFRSNGETVIQDNHRLIIYNASTRLFTEIPLPGKQTNLSFCMQEDKKGNIFLIHNSDILVLSAKNELTTWKPKRADPPFGFKSLLIDRSGTLWLGGNGSGIQLHDLRLSRFSGLPYKNIFHIDILQDYLKIAPVELHHTFLYDIQSYRFRWLDGGDGSFWLSKAVSDTVVGSPLCYYKNGHLRQTVWDYGNASTGAPVNISAMAFSQSRKLWGIDFFLRPVYFDTLSKKATVYPAVASIDFGYSYTVSSLLVDGEDIFWISTGLNGLYCFDKQKGRTVHYFYTETAGSLPTNQLMNLVQDPNNRSVLWIGSLGGGLIRFDKTTGKCKVYTTNDGLPNNTVYAIIADAKGILWCSSNKGIFSFDPQTGAVTGFTSKDGLPGDEYNRYHFFKLPDGRFAFGGLNGYTVFNPLEIANDDYQPAVALTGININNVPADFGDSSSPFTGAINSLDKIVLPYNQNFLTFKFSALQYNIPEKLRYRYKLEGVDNNWVNAGNVNIANYTKISPGTYTLSINATNTDGKWSSHVKTLLVIIQPPFWGTWWFTLLWVIAVAAIIYSIIRYRIGHVRKEEQQKAEFEREAIELKAQALRAQMNPHFIFNCLNSIKALIQEDKKIQAVNYLTTFSKLIRNQLNNAQQKISLHEELETCRLYTKLEALRFGANIICEFKIDEKVDTHALQVPPLILQPFIENAIWHGILPKDGGHVTISVSMQGDHVSCSVEDDGVGREVSRLNKSKKSVTYQSKGMKLVQGRLNLHNIINNQGGSIELVDKKDKSGQSTGTLVIVNFQKKET